MIVQSELQELLEKREEEKLIDGLVEYILENGFMKLKDFCTYQRIMYQKWLYERDIITEVIRIVSRVLKIDLETHIYNICTYGYSTIMLKEGNREGKWNPNIVYTTGLYDTLGLAEIVITGLEIKEANRVISNILNKIVERKGLDYGEPIILDDGTRLIIKVYDLKNYIEYLGINNWYYSYKEYRVIQVVYPDKDGKYPWDKDCEQEIKEKQVIYWDNPLKEIESKL